MPFDVTFTEDPALVLAEAGQFLASDRLRNNVMIVLLNDRVKTGEEGRYWIAKEANTVRGVVFQSPLNFSALVTPMQRKAVSGLVDRIASDGIALPGVGFEVVTASAFAGEWAARTNCAVNPTRVGRQYECRDVTPPERLASGEMRLAMRGQRDLMTDWLAQFRGVVSGSDVDIATEVDKAMSQERIYVWDADGAVSMVIQSPSQGDVGQIGIVFTPPEQRGKGYASACVAELTSRILASGNRCLLYTNLNNPTANHIYRQIGYQVVQETLQFEFE